mmetsp:Transcript_10471/g.29772  ORF Transcript_10471/g.29772 Transcript_10471/m.29772 type:complete len:111 (-) Transcript_10471:166-498(-)|eukprot:CAMPEP_0117677408 /NCGR_PEP_ID=MMETSP0804-20121206/16729_1 /TAXON_ID=1074897 /ORGANISM="Tetraselmis astigmatica, Strain CCMP880" /LENGTH=110 /DNA_ID=CAMNT_0005486689 /DNA_START=71 /DNA_END=403 /DNA_ORIENTATION=-
MATFRHTVLLTLQEDATAEQKAAIIDSLTSLPEKIPEILAYSVGLDAGLEPEKGNATIAIVADFADMEAYKVYASHAAHVGVITEFIKPVLTKRTAVQYSLTESFKFQRT